MGGAVPYIGACADPDRGGTLANRAVGGRDDGVGVEQDAAAEVRAALGQADDVGKLGSGSSGSTNDVPDRARCRDVTLRLLAGLQAEWLGRAPGVGAGDRSSHRDDGHRQSEGEGQEGSHRDGLAGRVRLTLGELVGRVVLELGLRSHFQGEEGDGSVIIYTRDREHICCAYSY